MRILTVVACLLCATVVWIALLSESLPERNLSRTELVEPQTAPTPTVGNHARAKIDAVGLVAQYESASRDERLEIVRTLARHDADAELLSLCIRPLGARECRALEGAWRSRPSDEELDRIAAALATASAKPCLVLLGIVARYHATRCSEAVVSVARRRRDGGVRKAAVETLGRLGDPISASALLRLVEQGSRTAGRALRHVRDPKGLESLADSYAEAGPVARAAIMQAIAHAPAFTPRLVATAQGATADRDAEIRAAAEYAIRRARG